MSPCLEDCPNEVVESIVVLLVLDDICSLRQTSRTMATKTTQTHFKSYFLTKHVDITGSSLRKPVNFTYPDSLGCLIQNLVLVSVVNNTQALEFLLDEVYRQYSADEERGKRRTEK